MTASSVGESSIASAHHEAAFRGYRLRTDSKQFFLVTCLWLTQTTSSRARQCARLLQARAFRDSHSMARTKHAWGGITLPSKLAPLDEANAASPRDVHAAAFFGSWATDCSRHSCLVNDRPPTIATASTDESSLPSLYHAMARRGSTARSLSRHACRVYTFPPTVTAPLGGTIDTRLLQAAALRGWHSTATSMHCCFVYPFPPTIAAPPVVMTSPNELHEGPWCASISNARS